MAPQLPTRCDVLEKYRGVIDSNDFEILASDSVPSPESLHQEDASLQYLGTLNGAYLWAKRQFGRVITVIVFFGGFMQGLQYINKYSRLACDEVAGIIQLAQRHSDVPATEYRIAERQDDWTLPPDQPFNLASIEPTTTTTTTTTADPSSSPFDALLPGSGLVPYSNEWQRLA